MYYIPLRSKDFVNKSTPLKCARQAKNNQFSSAWYDQMGLFVFVCFLQHKFGLWVKRLIRISLGNSFRRLLVVFLLSSTEQWHFISNRECKYSMSKVCLLCNQCGIHKRTAERQKRNALTWVEFVCLETLLSRIELCIVSNQFHCKNCKHKKYNSCCKWAESLIETDRICFPVTNPIQYFGQASKEFSEPPPWMIKACKGLL